MEQAVTLTRTLQQTPLGSVELLGSVLREHIVPRLRAGVIEIVSSDLARLGPTESLDWAPPHSLLPRHAHSTYEICWVAEGRCVLWLAGRTLPLDPRCACIIQPGEAHQLRPTLRLDPFWTQWWLPTPGGVILHEGTFANGRRSAVASFIELERPVAPLLESVTRELVIQRPHFGLVVAGSLLDLCGRILRGLEEVGVQRGKTETVAPERKAGWYVQLLAQHIQAHNGPDLTLDRLAAMVGLSPSYVSTLFRRYMGRTIIAYVNEVRLREARSLLRNTELSVGEVARLAGFDDRYYFSRLFKRREGCTPHQYRCLFRAAVAE